MEATTTTLTKSPNAKKTTSVKKSVSPLKKSVSPNTKSVSPHSKTAASKKQQATAKEVNVVKFEQSKELVDQPLPKKTQGTQSDKSEALIWKKVTWENYAGVKPKKPLTSFIFYILEQHDKEKKKLAKNPDAEKVTKTAQENQQAMKDFGSQWTKITDKRKEKYLKLYHKDVKRYNKEIDDINTNGFFINSDNIKSCDLKPKKKKNLSQSQPKEEVTKQEPSKEEVKTKEAVKPNKNYSSYVWFIEEMIPSLKKLDENQKVTELMVKASQMWKDLSADEKKRFEDMCKFDKERYVEQTTMLKKQGYFLFQDGTKSNELDKDTLKSKRKIKEMQKRLQKDFVLSKMHGLEDDDDDDDKDVSDDSSDDDQTQQDVKVEPKELKKEGTQEEQKEDTATQQD